MPPKIRVRERARDEYFAILKKDVSVPRAPSFETPTKCVKNLAISNIPSTVRINEVIKRIYPRTLLAIEKGIDPPSKTIFPKFLPNKLNLTIFDLRFDSIPKRDKLLSLASYWYASSKSTLFLPTVKVALLQDDRKFSEKRIGEYVEMMQVLIESAEMKNYKPFIGTIPLMPIKYSRPIIQLYTEKGITSFAIDVGTKDLLNHETDFRRILIQIQEGGVSLSEAFIYACNLGIPRFEQDKVRADDFLSFFAYVDAFGTTFKTRGGPQMRGVRPKVKRFVKEELSYEYLRHEMRYLADYNQREQLKESDVVRTLIGEEKIERYFETKNAVDSIALGRLGSIAEKVEIK